MAIEDCEFCGCVSGNMSDSFFYQAILSTLCTLIEGGIPIVPTPAEATPLAAVSRDGLTQITTSYTVTGFTGTNVATVSVDNSTDATVTFSLDGVTPFWTVLPFSSSTYSASPGTFDITNLQVKGNVVPGSGVVLISGVSIS